jgi:hypothetical protein
VLFRKYTTLIALSLVLTIVLAVAGCSSQSLETDRLVSDLEVGDFTARLESTEPDDVAQILGINRWKFTLKRDSDEELGLEAILAINSPDKPTEIIDEIRVFTTETDVEGMVGIYPLGGSLANAAEIRIYMQAGAGSTSSVIPNPFKEFSSWYTANPADVLEDDVLRLMAFSDNEPMPGPENTVLTLQLTTYVE